MSQKNPRPFLKWAGGKTQLLEDIKEKLPADLSEDYTYFEPFVGGGAVFFSLFKEYKFKRAYLGDINKDLILTYHIIQTKPRRLISILKNYKRNYDSEKFDNKELFYNTRGIFNEFEDDFDPFEESSKNIARAAQMIFLNKTCFNGLYRVNRNGKFNVPFANPKNPLICDEENILEVHDALEKVNLVLGDFYNFKKLIKGKSFVYLDPPYKPVDGKESFNGYTKEGFDNSDQKRLAEFCHEIKDKSYILLSNSKPDDDSLFVELYDDNDFIRDEVLAKRAINSNGKKRGEIKELLIYNKYEIKK